MASFTNDSGSPQKENKFFEQLNNLTESGVSKEELIKGFLADLANDPSVGPNGIKPNEVQELLSLLGGKSSSLDQNQSSPSLSNLTLNDNVSHPLPPPTPTNTPIKANPNPKANTKKESFLSSFPPSTLPNILPDAYEQITKGKASEPCDRRMRSSVRNCLITWLHPLLN